MRRSLVVTDEGAHHPFRMSLPPHVCAGATSEPAQGWRRQLTRRDWRDLLAVYTSGFVAVSLFIA